MSTLADKLNYLIDTKQAIKDAIVAKGVSVSSDDTFRSYAAKIGSIADSDFEISGKDATYLFYSGCRWIIKDLLYSKISNITSLNNTYYNNKSITDFNNNFDSSLVTDFSNCFQFCSNLVSVNINTNSAMSLDNFLNICTNLTSATFSNLSNVTSMNSAFSGCSKLTALLNLNISKAVSMSSTFNGCTLLTRLTFTGATDIKSNMTLSGTGLTHAGLVEMIASLPTASSSRTITIGATKLAMLSADEKAVATGKNYVLI